MLLKKEKETYKWESRRMVMLLLSPCDSNSQRWISAKISMWGIKIWQWRKEQSHRFPQILSHIHVHPIWEQEQLLKKKKKKKSEQRKKRKKHKVKIKYWLSVWLLVAVLRGEPHPRNIVWSQVEENCHHLHPNLKKKKRKIEHVR